MKDHPILMNGTNVVRILEGRKTQTRRVMRPQPKKKDNGFWEWKNCGWNRDDIGPPAPTLRRGPFGCAGDRLWVRETFHYGWSQEEHFYNGMDGESLSELVWTRGDVDPSEDIVWYAADGPPGHVGMYDEWATQKTPSIFMPKWACRLWLDVVDVRVERLQSITAEDAQAEGIEICGTADGVPLLPLNGIIREHPLWADPKNATVDDYWTGYFARSWNKINAKRGFGWEANPWVWVVEFEHKENS